MPEPIVAYFRQLRNQSQVLVLKPVSGERYITPHSLFDSRYLLLVCRLLPFGV
jgi:hypothetical protein